MTTQRLPLINTRKTIIDVICVLKFNFSGILQDDFLKQLFMVTCEEFIASDNREGFSFLLFSFLFRTNLGPH